MSNAPAPVLNITEMLKDGRHFSERHGDTVHIIDSLTGDKYITRASTKEVLTPGVLELTVLPDGRKVWSESGIDVKTVGGRATLAFSPTIISEMAQRIAEGAGITALCKEPNMPTYAQLRLWARTYPWIDVEFEKARRDRAETFRDKAVKEAEDAVSKDPIDGHALRVDTYKWSASMDHERYNPKTKVEATINTPTQIVVYTGIDRSQPREVTEIPVEDQRG